MGSSTVYRRKHIKIEEVSGMSKGSMNEVKNNKGLKTVYIACLVLVVLVTVGTIVCSIKFYDDVVWSGMVKDNIVCILCELFTIAWLSLKVSNRRISLIKNSSI